MQKIVLRLKGIVWQSRFLLILLCGYFFLRLLMLSSLPIFNDEAIYLDWGWRETHTPGMLYYSLYDEKPPFLMWIFGLMEQLFSDPLVAGRVVSVICGAFSLVGLFLLGKKLWNKEVGMLAGISYIVIPLFSFFNRLALMEGAIAAVGVWSCWYALRVWEKQHISDAIILGILIGIGFFIKTNAILFLVTFVIIALVISLRNKQMKLISAAGIVIVSFTVSSGLLVINPQFWENLPLNARYSLSLHELLSFPLVVWIHNVVGNLQILFFLVTPVIFISAIAGISAVWKEHRKNRTVLLVLGWFLIGIALQTLFVRLTSSRYLVSYLPLLCLFASFFLYKLYRWQRAVGIIVSVIVLLLPLVLTVIQIFQPPVYLTLLSSVTPYAGPEYVVGQTAGYGVPETVQYLQKKATEQSIYVGIADNTGNPESAMQTYFTKNPRIKVIYLDQRLFRNSLNHIDCLRFDRPLYFISRDEQLAGLDKYLEKVQTIPTITSSYTIGIYQVKQQCTGKSLPISLSELQ